MHKIYSTPFNDVYLLYIAKVERKGQSAADIDVVIRWLTGYTDAALKKHLKNGTTFRDFFEGATINPNAELITGKICGVTIQEIEDPLMKQIRYLDKLVDEVAKGRAMEKILRK
ncbi:MAG: hypothetical protein RLZZ426_572 [Actinomycetota bacterium]